MTVDIEAPVVEFDSETIKWTLLLIHVSVFV